MSVLTLIAEEIVPLFGIDSLFACVHVDIDWMRSCPCLALIVYVLVSVLTLILEEIVPVFGNDSLLACVCVDIDRGRNRANVWH